MENLTAIVRTDVNNVYSKATTVNTIDDLMSCYFYLVQKNYCCEINIVIKVDQI